MTTRRFPRYPAYKDSGVEWLGEIPAHWEVKRLKYLLAEPLKYGANEAAELDDPDLPRYIRITDIDERDGLREDTFKSLPVDVAEEYLLHEGDLLFARSGATAGKTFLYRRSWGTCAYAGYLIRARLDTTRVCPEFVRYFTASSSYRQWLSSAFIQATIQNVSAEKYASLVVAHPPYPEQRAIAASLDRETARIDALVAKKERLIDLLQEQRTALITGAVTRGLDPQVAMKDSGVQWLGAIPAHWEVTPLKRIFANLDSRRVPLSGEERATMTKDYPYYGASGVIDHVEDYIFDEPLILVAEDGANLYSRSTALAFVANGKYWVNNHAHILKPLDGDVSYWAQVLSCVVLDPWISGSAQPKLTGEKLGSIPLPVIPLLERHAIAAFLDRETARIDTLVAKVRDAIECLDELRTALISAAVTGKIDVRAASAEAAASQGGAL